LVGVVLRIVVAKVKKVLTMTRNEDRFSNSQAHFNIYLGAGMPCGQLKILILCFLNNYFKNTE
jgi:hypothetical protein